MKQPHRLPLTEEASLQAESSTAQICHSNHAVHLAEEHNLLQLEGLAVVESQNSMCNAKSTMDNY